MVVGGNWWELVGGLVGSLAWALEKVRWGGRDGWSRAVVVVVVLGGGRHNASSGMAS